MSLVKILLGYRDFSTIEALRIRIANDEKNTIENVHEMLLFNSNVQKTWLICTDHALYCALDDIRLDESTIKWKLSKSSIINSNTMFLSLIIKNDLRQPMKYGRVDFGTYHKNWLYSKSLFSTPEYLQSMFLELIRVSMIDK